MSLLNSILSSIGTEGSPQPLSSKKSTDPTPSSTNSRATVKSETARVPLPKPSADRKPLLPNGLKRKAEDQPCHDSTKLSKTSGDRSSSKPIAPTRTGIKVQTPSRPPAATEKTPATNGKPLQPKRPATAPVVPPKAPTKGSYADLMARAKAAQAEKAAPVGVIRHQNVPKERLSKMEKKKRLEEARAKEREAKTGKKTFGRVSTDPRSSGKIQKPGVALKDRAAPESGYKGTARPAPSAPTPAYKGTSGFASRRPPPSGNDRHRPRKEDRYLDTDEEDLDGGEEDLGEEDEGGYSDASSDMEAGMFDVDEEENRALKVAKKEDEEELRKENQLKREKEDRRRRLEALAAKAKKKSY